MKRYMIERDIPEVGSFEREQLRDASKTSNKALAQLAPRVQWDHSYVAGDKTFCIYLAKDEATIHKHAELSGIPVSAITEVSQIIDPLTANN